MRSQFSLLIGLATASQLLGQDVGEPEGAPWRGPLVAELNAAKAAADRRLATAVTALANLRLDVLRLKAGVGRPDDLTGAIEEARSMGETVDAELAARQEVESLSSDRVS